MESTLDKQGNAGCGSLVDDMQSMKDILRI